MRIKFYDPFLTFSSVAEKTGLCREVILAAGDMRERPLPL